VSQSVAPNQASGAIASGFRGSAGNSFCVTGTSAGCPKLYNNVGLEAWTALARGPLSLVAGGGPYATDLSRDYYSAKLGFKVRATAGRISLSIMPSVFVAATHRDAMPTPNTDVLYVPAALALKLAPSFTVGLGSGVKGPISGFSSKWQVPLGASAILTAGPVQIGAAFTFGALLGGAADPPPPAAPVTGTDLRVVQAWLSYSWRPAPPPKAAIVVRREAPLAPAPQPAVAAPVPEPVVEAPVARLGDPAAERVPDDEIVATVRDIRGCGGGEISIAFETDGGGNVTRTAVVSTADIAVTDCALRTLRDRRFPERAASGIVNVSSR
jgi:hypothetical protein